MDGLDDLTSLLSGKKIAALTGAGCSTESGIPDYRGPGTTARAKNPMEWKQFAASEHARKRYWARAMVGWERFSKARPSGSHHALARLESDAVLTGVITQNVDRLHHAAGSQRVVELHGALAETRCTDCGGRESRSSVQARLFAQNPTFAPARAELLPDGDALLADELVEGFSPPTCLFCGGVLRPDVVFFGENVARPTVDAAFAMLDAADALLVVGSSLAVFSGYRFVRKAAERGIPIAIVNRGATRGDPYATLKVDAGAGELLGALADALGASGGRLSDPSRGETALPLPRASS